MEKVANNEISEYQALTDPRRNHLTSALTGGKINLIDSNEQQLSVLDGDVFLLASDGVESIHDEQLLNLVVGNEGCSAGDIAINLIEHIEEKKMSHQDNASVIVLLVSEV